MSAYPVLMHTALDTTDCRGLAEFYRQFLGLWYRPAMRSPLTVAPMTRTGWSCWTHRGTGYLLSSRSRRSRDRPGPLTMYPSRCIMTSVCPTSTNCSVNGSARRNSAPPSCTTALTTRVSRCTCSLTPPDIPSAFSSVLCDLRRHALQLQRPQAAGHQPANRRLPGATRLPRVGAILTVLGNLLAEIALTITDPRLRLVSPRQ